MNNLAIRRATEELKVAHDYEQLRRILLAAFGTNDFDSFELRLDMLPGELVAFDRLASPSPGHTINSFRWSKPGVPKNLDGCAWTISLDLVSSGNRHCGSLVVYRLYSRRNLQLDVNLLTGAFPTALADALDRTLSHSAVLAMQQQPSLITAQAG